ncbi:MULTISPECIES: hypothetical protein [Bacillus]|uniref:hypothetical protein n=1 Tax=Bacillus TaxID=1386 RepID=UPI00129023C0|nr:MULTISPECIES: hypothetical protein [Bacillus]MDH7999975.1 hypothetical protein [Bacillus cereus]NKW84125.1 hypothetical protein [Bacillus cereus]HDR4389868.1 hypothetical protein [Bacillus cereus]HDR4600457.1 hypothetical protein [Bacillus cereus]HDR4658050.1 hypothetical protein [Bacillus cereus]
MNIRKKRYVFWRGLDGIPIGSEKLEKSLYSQLVNRGYIVLKISDYNTLLANFRNQLNEL